MAMVREEFESRSTAKPTFSASMALRPKVRLPTRQTFSAVMTWRSARKRATAAEQQDTLALRRGDMQQGPRATVGGLMRQ
jgi:hypothetical protein